MEGLTQKTLDTLNSLYPTDMKVKAALFKVVEVNYSKENGLDLKGMVKKGPVKVTVDKDGRVTVKGRIANVSLKGTPELKALGANFKKLDIEFSDKGGDDIGFNVWFTVVKGVGFGIEGSFDLAKFMLDRGLLQRAYRGYYRGADERFKQIEDAVNGKTSN